MEIPDRWAAANPNVVDIRHLSPDQEREVRVMAAVDNFSRVQVEAQQLAKGLLRHARASSPLSKEGQMRWLYEQIPSSQCAVGDCADSCTAIAMSPLEARMVERATGLKQEAFLAYLDDGCTACPLLQEDGACGAYDVRPIVCRLFGVVPEMACSTPGCKPPQVLSSAEGFAILIACGEIGGRT